MALSQSTGIFSKASNAYSQLDALHRTQQNDHPIFAELFSALADAGIPVRYAAAVNQKGSSAANATTHKAEPCLSLYISSSQAFATLGVSPRDNNWSSTAPSTSFIRTLWTNCCARHGFAEYASPDMFVFFYDLQELHLTALPYACKSQLTALLMGPGKHIKPKHLFVSSQPGVSVVYGGPTEKISEERNGNIERHREAILQVLKTADIHDCFSADRVQIHFFDAKTNGDILYGLSRED